MILRQRKGSRGDAAAASAVDATIIPTVSSSTLPVSSSLMTGGAPCPSPVDKNNRSGRPWIIEDASASQATAPKKKNRWFTAKTTRQVWLWRSLSFLLFLIPCLFVAWGAVLWFTVLAKHDECDMTWMRPTYLPVVWNSSSSKHSYYTLYRYRDDRDPRPTTTKTATLAVLFVPGHGGSYQQARSLGTHITLKAPLTRRHVTRSQLWESQQSLLQASSSSLSDSGDSDGGGNSSSSRKKKKKNVLSWDVYTLDFREEPTGLHGRFVRDQSDFVRKSITFLKQEQKYAHVVVVAHSLGGYSSLLAAAQSEAAEDARRSSSSPVGGGEKGGEGEDDNTYSLLLTLGTPHKHPVLTWDWTLRSIHRELQKQQQHLLRPLTTDVDDNKAFSPMMVVVSISGGLRDEIIPPSACEAGATAASKATKNTNHSTSSMLFSSSFLSWMAVDIMKPVQDENKVPPALGMDHRAIVWCHNLLEPVAEILSNTAAFFLFDSSSSSSSSSSSYSSSSFENLNHTTTTTTQQHHQYQRRRLHRAVQQSLMTMMMHDHREGRDTHTHSHTHTNFNDKHHGDGDYYTYSKALEKQSETLRTLYGTLPALAMETAALYNAEWLVNLFSCTALVHWSLVLPALRLLRSVPPAAHKKQPLLIHHIISIMTAVVVPLVVATQAWWSSSARHLPWTSLWILSGVAHAVFCSIRWLLELLIRCKATRRSSGTRRQQLDDNASATNKSISSGVHHDHKNQQLSSYSFMSLLSHALPLFATGLGMVLSECSASTTVTWNSAIDLLEIVLAAMALVGVYVLAASLLAQKSSLPSSSSFIQEQDLARIVVLLTWMLPVLPFLVAGEVAWMVLRRNVNSTFWWVVLPFVFWLTCVRSYCLTTTTMEQQQQYSSSSSTTASIGSNLLLQRIRMPLLRVLAAAVGSDRLFRSLWTAADCRNYDAPLVYQVLLAILCEDLVTRINKP